MLTGYLTQTCVLRHKTGTDDRGQPVYAAPATVSCRRQSKVQTILREDGEAVKSQTVYYLTAEIAPGDSIDGKPVLTVTDMLGVLGDRIGYKAVI